MVKPGASDIEHANTADIATGTLTTGSPQDTHENENSSMGVNVAVGAGTDGVGNHKSEAVSPVKSHW